MTAALALSTSVGLPFLDADQVVPCMRFRDVFDKAADAANSNAATPTAEHRAAIGDAVTMCRACPVMVACGEHAIAQREPCGVWGGLTPNRRAAIANRRARRRAAA